MELSCSGKSTLRGENQLLPSTNDLSVSRTEQGYLMPTESTSTARTFRGSHLLRPPAIVSRRQLRTGGSAAAAPLRADFNMGHRNCSFGESAFLLDGWSVPLKPGVPGAVY